MVVVAKSTCSSLGPHSLLLPSQPDANNVPAASPVPKTPEPSIVVLFDGLRACRRLEALHNTHYSILYVLYYRVAATERYTDGLLFALLVVTFNSNFLLCK